MKRSTLLYVGLFCIAGFILWGVIAIGNRLKAPRDLSGIWRVRGDTPDAESGEVVRINQSGRFLSVTLGEREPMEFRWTGEEANAAAGVYVVYLYNDRHILTVSIRPLANDAGVRQAAEFVLEGHRYEVWRAERRGPEPPLPIETRLEQRSQAKLNF